MKCDAIIQHVLEQEDTRYLSPATRWHRLFCSECRNEIRELQKVFAAARGTAPFQGPHDITKTIMDRIILSSSRDEIDISSVSLMKWTLAGLIIFASIFLSSYNESLIWLKIYFGSGLEIPFSIVLGLLFTSYAALFMGVHIEGIKKLAAFLSRRSH